MPRVRVSEVRQRGRPAGWKFADGQEPAEDQRELTSAEERAEFNDGFSEGIAFHNTEHYDDGEAI